MPANPPVGNQVSNGKGIHRSPEFTFSDSSRTDSKFGQKSVIHSKDTDLLDVSMVDRNGYRTRERFHHAVRNAPPPAIRIRLESRGTLFSHQVGVEQ